MTVETSFNYPSDLNASYPAAGDNIPEGDDHIRGIKTVLKTTFPNVSGAITPTHTELNYVDGVTSAIQTQLDAKAPIASPTFTGTPAAPTATVGTATTQLATTAFVAATSLVSALPGQVGNSGKFVTTDGTNASWSLVPLASSVSGTLPIANGGTGLTSPGTSGNLLVSNGTALVSTNIVATQAQMEAASSGAVYATPSNTNWHPGVSKVWIKCDAAGAIAASHNVTSITDDGTGLVTVTIATDFSSADYAVVCSTLQTAGSRTMAVIKAQAAGSFQINAMDTNSGTPTDPTGYYAVCFGDQA